MNDEREEIRKISIQAKEELERLLYSGDAYSGQMPKVVLYDLALLRAVAEGINILDY
ncbi:hypothetical protein [Brachyspira aalborgi]|uniref:hypothetical protein n=1 Tax=Brachyspira aalborgi TaxID=29522 RepID=UPI00131591AA|nr:hypothetical protein [Brachyspira aalborgi]MBS4762474.1 hypothetical protein [Brachyspira sp.]